MKKMQEFLFAAIVVAIWLVMKYFSPEQRLKRFNVEKRIKMQEMQLEMLEDLQRIYDTKVSVWGAYSREAQSIKQKMDELKKELDDINITRSRTKRLTFRSRSNHGLDDKTMV